MKFYICSASNFEGIKAYVLRYTRLCQAKNWFLVCRCDVIKTSSIPHENNSEVVINRVQFDGCTPSSLGLVNKNKNKKNLCFIIQSNLLGWAATCYLRTPALRYSESFSIKNES